MPTNYIKKLHNDGKGSIAELEKKWEDAKNQARKQQKEDNFAYVTSIFKKMIHEFLSQDKPKLTDETPSPDFEQINSDYESKKTYENHLDNLLAGKYMLNTDDVYGNWKKGDVINVPCNKPPKKKMVNKNVYEININNIAVYITKDFLTPINENEGGMGGNFVGTGNIATYETPISKKKTQKRKNIDLFWDENELMGDDEDELDECGGTDFTYAWDDVKKGKIGDVEDNIKKKLKIHSPELVKNKKK